jgi:predicted nucleic acid-binding protein
MKDAGEPVCPRCFHRAREHGLTSYDAAYLDLALQNELLLATLDDELGRACKKARVRLLQM